MSTPVVDFSFPGLTAQKATYSDAFKYRMLAPKIGVITALSIGAFLSLANLSFFKEKLPFKVSFSLNLCAVIIAGAISLLGAFLFPTKTMIEEEEAFMNCINQNPLDAKSANTICSNPHLLERVLSHLKTNKSKDLNTKIIALPFSEALLPLLYYAFNVWGYDTGLICRLLASDIDMEDQYWNQLDKNKMENFLNHDKICKENDKIELSTAILAATNLKAILDRLKKI